MVPGKLSSIHVIVTPLTLVEIYSFVGETEENGAYLTE